MFCLKCSYPLGGLSSHTCPECGTKFDPSDASTFRPEARARWWAKRAGPPSILSSSIVIGMTAIWLLGSTDPGGPVVSTCFIALLFPLVFAILGIDWIWRVLATIRLAQLNDRECDTLPTRSRIRWLALPLGIALCISPLIYPWPVVLRFAPCRAQLEKEAERLLSTTPSGKPIEFAQVTKSEFGTYSLHRARLIRRFGWVLFSTGGSPFGSWGFRYQRTVASDQFLPHWSVYVDEK